MSEKKYTIKQLKWRGMPDEDSPLNEWVAYLPAEFSSYYVTETLAGFTAEVEWGNDYKGIGNGYPNFDEAKSACQAHWERCLGQVLEEA